MSRYIFTGDIVRPGRVIIDADTLEDAIHVADNNGFHSVYDENQQDFLAAFNWNEDEDTIEELNEPS